jgi:hypothetical protein
MLSLGKYTTIIFENAHHLDWKIQKQCFKKKQNSKIKKYTLVKKEVHTNNISKYSHLM